MLGSLSTHPVVLTGAARIIRDEGLTDAAVQRIIVVDHTYVPIAGLEDVARQYAVVDGRQTPDVVAAEVEQLEGAASI